MVDKIDDTPDDETAKRLGLELKFLREKKRYSQAEVGRMLGVSRQAVSMWEAGTNTPSPRRLNALLEMLGAPEIARNVADELMKPDVRERLHQATDIPLYRTGPPGFGNKGFNFLEPIAGWLKAPDSLPAHKVVICFLMNDSSMVPWRAPGEPVFVEQKRYPKIGDHALIYRGEPGKLAPRNFDDGPLAYFVRLVTGLGPDTIRLKSYLSGEEEVVPLSEISDMQRVLEWSEIYGPTAKVWQSSSFD